MNIVYTTRIPESESHEPILTIFHTTGGRTVVCGGIRRGRRSALSTEDRVKPLLVSWTAADQF